MSNTMNDTFYNNMSYLDSAYTSHYMKEKTHFVNKNTVHDGVKVLLPNGAWIQSSTTFNLEIQGLTTKRYRGEYVPEYACEPRLSRPTLR